MIKNNKFKILTYILTLIFLNGCQNLQQLLGDKDSPGLHQKLQNEIAIFQDDPELYNLYKQLFNLTESRLQYDK